MYERQIFAKTARNNARGDAEIVLLEDKVGVQVRGGPALLRHRARRERDQPEHRAKRLRDAVSLLPAACRKRSALENLDLVLLTIDELVDNGIILDDANVIANRVSMGGGQQTLAEQTPSQALATAKEQLRGTFQVDGARA